MAEDKSPDAELAANLRAQHVDGLTTELAYLERQPKPDTRRVAEVKAELDKYSEKPAKRTRETRKA